MFHLGSSRWRGEGRVYDQGWAHTASRARLLPLKAWLSSSFMTVRKSFRWTMPRCPHLWYRVIGIGIAQLVNTQLFEIVYRLVHKNTESSGWHMYVLVMEPQNFELKIKSLVWLFVDGASTVINEVIRVRPWSIGLVPLGKEEQTPQISFSCTQRKDQICQPEREASPETKPESTFILDFQLPDWEINFC